jgi:hypothetical protein
MSRRGGRRPPGSRDRTADDRRGAVLAPRQRHGREHLQPGPRRADPGRRADERRLRARCAAARRAGAPDDRRRPRHHEPGLPGGRHGDGAAGRARTRRQLQPRARPRVGSDARARGAQPRLQRPARRRDQPRTRPAQRPQLRVPVGGPAAVGGARRRVDRRRPGRGRHLDDQALLAQLQRDEPPLAGRADRPRRAPRVRPAGVRDRDRALAAGLGDDRLQQGQR